MNTAELVQDERNVASIGVIERRAGPTQASSAPSGDRELHEATSLGAAICFA